jgi:RHS repeat-associated protein
VAVYTDRSDASGNPVTAATASTTGPPTDIEYLHPDHLGSTAAISNSLGAIAERYSYDAWGDRRQTNGVQDKLNTIQPGTLDAAQSTNRGFTGHERLERGNMGLIHANARIYDPSLGLFLSADPNIQTPNNSQSYNRYNYTFNNPLAFTDPTGYIGIPQTDSLLLNSTSGGAGGVMQPGWKNRGFLMPGWLYAAMLNGLIGHGAWLQYDPNMYPGQSGEECSSAVKCMNQEAARDRAVRQAAFTPPSGTTTERLNDGRSAGAGCQDCVKVSASVVPNIKMLGTAALANPAMAEAAIACVASVGCMGVVVLGGAAVYLAYEYGPSFWGYLSNNVLSSSSGGKNQGALNSDKGATVTAAAGGAAPPPGDGDDEKQQKQRDHGKQRANDAKTDSSRSVGDANRIIRDGKKYMDDTTGNNVHVSGDRVVITNEQGDIVSQFRNSRANTNARIESGRWIPAPPSGP